MSSAVLFDNPGPRARARHRIYGVAGLLLVLGLLGYVGRLLWQRDQITPDAWRFLAEPRIVAALVDGLVATLTAAVAAIAVAVIFGAVFAAAKLSDQAWLRWPATAVVEFFRATPVLLLMFGLYLTFGATLGTYWSVVLALTLYNGSVLAEVFRAGILAVPVGQREAGMAIGLHKRQVLRLILAPQAVATMLPAIISQCVIALKDTALGYAIGAPELTRAAKSIYTSITYDNPLAVGLLLLATFVAINVTLSRTAQWLEARLRRTRRRKRSPHAKETEWISNSPAG
jgi:glutamate transport system permease protein